MFACSSGVVYILTCVYFSRPWNWSGSHEDGRWNQYRRERFTNHRKTSIANHTLSNVLKLQDKKCISAYLFSIGLDDQDPSQWDDADLSHLVVPDGDYPSDSEEEEGEEEEEEEDQRGGGGGSADTVSHLVVPEPDLLSSDSEEEEGEEEEEEQVEEEEEQEEEEEPRKRSRR